MNFWINYMDRKPILAMAWLRLAAYESLGEVHS